MGRRRNDAPTSPSVPPAPTIERLVQRFAIEWFPILASLALKTAMFVMIYQYVV